MLAEYAKLLVVDWPGVHARPLFPIHNLPNLLKYSSHLPSPSSSIVVRDRERSFSLFPSPLSGTTGLCGVIWNVYYPKRTSGLGPTLAGQ